MRGACQEEFEHAVRARILTPTLTLTLILILTLTPTLTLTLALSLTRSYQVSASSTPARACLSSSSAPWSPPTVAAAPGCRAWEGGRVRARGGRRAGPTAAHAQRRRLQNRGLRLGLRTA